MAGVGLGGGIGGSGPDGGAKCSCVTAAGRIGAGSTPPDPASRRCHVHPTYFPVLFPTPAILTRHLLYSNVR